MPWVRHICHCGQSMVPGSFTAARDTSVSLSTTWDHWDHRPVFPAPGEAGNAPEQCFAKSRHCFLTCQAGTLPPLGSGRSQRRAGEGGTGEHQFMLAFHVGFQYARPAVVVIPSHLESPATRQQPIEDYHPTSTWNTSVHKTDEMEK